MVNVSQLKKIINSDFKGGSGSVTLLLRFLNKPEEKDLSWWYVITKEPFGFVKFEKWFKDLPLKDKEMLRSYFEFLKK